ncbi:MAG TPA: phosphorylase [Casimicrobiaceae bacterium]|jgi:hopanoid-associated phosphorylase
MPVVAVTGLAVEARIAAGPGVRALAGGLDGQQLAAALEREVARGVGAIISFGIAGGLVADLATGTWLVGRGIVTPTIYRPCDMTWTLTLRERLPGARYDDLAGLDAPVTEPAAKRALQRATSAIAVDTESHIAAAVAAAHGLPFAVFRVIADPVGRALPPAASAALRPGGAINVAAVVRSLARTPSQLPLLVRTAIDARAALRALLRGRRRLGGRLGYVELRLLELDVA